MHLALLLLTLGCGGSTEAPVVQAPAPAEVAEATPVHIDPEMAAVCQACATEEDHDPADVVEQPGAKVGDLTRCPVSGVVFRVTEEHPSTVRDGKTWFTCCGACMERFAQG